ncbi:Ig-like domain-containing protein [Neobacillus soli]|uniref:Ig-like domain-containing protein n=1 Tax=Neobacillus soli TaxID=220688 RepID=UPI0008250BFF|nr:Ig-like domain-containing protein [Neobacillus soli]
MKKKLIYTGITATLLLTGSQSTKTFAASPVSVAKKNIEEIKRVSISNGRDSRFSQLDVSKIINKTSSSGFRTLAAENNYITETEPNDFFTMADPLPMETGMVGDFSYNRFRDGDFDSFEIKVTEPGYLFLGVGLYQVDYYTDLGFGLFDSNEQIVEPEYYDSDGGITFQVLPVSPGTYYAATTNFNEIASYDEYFLYASMLADTTAPDAPKVNPVDDNDKIITGKAEANSTVAIKNGTAAFKTVNTDATGNFKLNLSTPFKAGTKLYFTAKDSSGNISKASSVTVLDKTPPAVPKVNPVDDNDKSMTGKAEAYSKITIKNGTKLFSTVNVDKYGNFKLSIKPFKAGTKLYFTATDKNKNISKVTTVKVADKTPPSTLTVNKVSKTSKYVSGKTEAKASVTVKVGSKTLGSGKSDSKGYFKLKIKPQKKNTSLSVTAKDSSGNSKTVKVKVR